MIPVPIESVLVDRNVETDERALSILGRLTGVPVESVEGPGEVIRSLRALRDPIGSGKRRLFLTAHKGKMVAKCPGTSGHICCGYQIIDLMSNCPMDCSYCILQAYLNNPAITVFVNLSDLIDELEDAATRVRGSFFRVGSGELSDSLALDHLTRFADELIPWFARRPNMILELKTKSRQVDHLLGLGHGGQTVVSWSLNPPSIIEAEEHGAPTLNERIDAARRCQEAGYPIGLHFDPMIFHGSWEGDYRDMVAEIFRSLDPGRIIWISMGALRLPPSMRSVIRDRFSGSGVLLGELFPGKDGKLRYLETIRVHMFRKMLSWLRDVDPGVFVYLCMESHSVWQAVFGWSPESTSGLVGLFDRRCRAFMAPGESGAPFPGLKRRGLKAI